MNNKRKKSSIYQAAKKKNKSLDVIHLTLTMDDNTVYLNEEKTSWVLIRKLSCGEEGKGGGMSLDEFEDLWKFKPKEKLKIKIAGKLIECPRFSKSYLNSYTFTGLNHEVEHNIPNRIQQLLDWSKVNYNNIYLNQALVNWYEADGYIGHHSDDTKQLLPDSNVFSFSFGPAIRRFVLKPKKGTKHNNKEFQLKLEHNCLVIMGGKCQETHTHSVPKANKSDITERRLNVTFRSFK